MSQSKVCVQEFWYFVSGLDIQVEKSEYYSPVRQKISCRWRNIMSHILFFSSIWYDPMVEWLRLVAESQASWVRFLKCTDTLYQVSASLYGTEPVSALTRKLFISLCSLYFFLSWISSVANHWRSCADRVVNLNPTIRHPLFWRTWTLALAHMCWPGT